MNLARNLSPGIDRSSQPLSLPLESRSRFILDGPAYESMANQHLAREPSAQRTQRRDVIGLLQSLQGEHTFHSVNELRSSDLCMIDLPATCCQDLQQLDGFKVIWLHV